ncbi:hypothetical protein [Tsukamurella tyrosinosolvens]|uniref:hypothetical protein n=1 Tax=Tsukamurella tyrosinosolvens TaxID=57704 RepID=UPI00125EC4C2|nr:hypothetical protein [Tsukamurella tyrosinosolvens]
MSEEASDDDYRHPRCYANLHGGCSRKISGEHYISHALIRLYTFDAPGVTIKPTPNYRIPVAVAPSKFKANVLCARHNSMLSKADQAALDFATFLRTIAIRYRGGAGDWGEPESVTISGDDFQLWVLKLLITHAAADVYTRDEGERVTTLVSDDAIELLLGRSGWPIDWGVGVQGTPFNKKLSYDPFSRSETVIDQWWGAQPFIKHEPIQLLGGVVDLAGVSFTLCLFNQSGAREDKREINPLRGVLQRPASMTWKLDGVPKTVNFEWTDAYEHLPVTFTIRRDKWLLRMRDAVAFTKRSARMIRAAVRR